MSVKFTPQQLEAITFFGNNVIVSAGAGSGKTAVLSERVLYFVKEKQFKLSSFLILTFTRLAANEMKERIRKKLTENNLEEAKYVDTANITTFDSYAYSLVKKYHFLLNISRNIKIIDTNVISVIKRVHINEVLEKAYQRQDRVFLDLVKKLCFKNDVTLQQLLFKINEMASLSTNKNDYYQNYESKYLSQDSLNSIKESVLFAVKDRLDAVLNALKQVDDVNNYQSKSEELLTSLKENQSLSSFQKALSEIKLPRANGFEEEQKFAQKAFLDKFRKYKESVLALESEEELEQNHLTNKEQILYLLSLAKESDELDNQYKKEHQVYEFSDIAKMALDLLKNHHEVKDYLKNQLKMIMIDEYQDTSDIQEEFVNLISDKNLYMVGDIKQSIYRFRNANSEIFLNKYLLYKKGQGGYAIDLHDNFRSRFEVIDDINAMFSEIMSLDYGGADYRNSHIIHAGNKAYLAPSSSRNVDFYTYSSELKSLERTKKEIEIIASDISEKIINKYEVYDPKENQLRPCRFGDFCILIDRGTSFNLYQKVFEDNHLPLFVENDVDIAENQFTKIIYNLILLISLIKKGEITSVEFKHAFASIGRSFIYQYDDKYLYKVITNNAYKNTSLWVDFNQVINEFNMSSTYRIFKELIFELKVYSKLVLIGDVLTNETYLDNFLTSFKAMEELDFEAEDYLDYLDHVSEYNLKITVPSSKTEIDSIKLMNIHKSKGLEFAICYFAGLKVAFNTQDRKQTKIVSKKLGVILPYHNRRGIYHYVNDYLEEKDDISERIRLFYVALTRVKEKMIIVSPAFEQVVPINQIKSFYDLVSNVAFKYQHQDYQNKPLVSYQEEPKLVEKKELIIENLYLEYQKVFKKKFSKDPNFTINYDLLEYGTKLHYYLEIIDFKNPDYAFITTTKEQRMIKEMIESKLIQNNIEGKFYQEYQFIEDDTNQIGIIDLLIEKEDKMIIIDYKLKNINDEKYQKQLSHYQKYIVKTFNKPCEVYLYSLIDRRYQDLTPSLT